MHDALKRADVQRLMQVNTHHAVSLYMPANRVTTEVQKDTLRFKNLVSQAQDELMARGMRRPDALKLLKPAADLLKDSEFWQNQSHGLAVFLSPQTDAEIYRLPVRFSGFWQISYRFYVKPLLRLFSHAGHYFLLALSQKEVRFFRGDRDGLVQETVENLPTSIEDELGEWETERELQHHTGTGTSSGDGRQAAMFHGHADSEVQMKDELLRFFRRIDAALHPILREERVPLILAAVDYLQPLFAQASSYAHLLEEGVTGSPEEESEQDLHAASWQIVEPVFAMRIKQDHGQFAQLAGTGRTGVYVDELSEAAYQGRIETAFLPRGMRVWGTFDVELGKVVAQAEPTRHESGSTASGANHEPDQANGRPREDIRDEDKEDLLDFIALHTFLNGGTVHILERAQIPGNHAAAAIYRF